MILVNGTTLDVIGLAGFNYKFNPEPRDAETKKASSTMSHIRNELLSNSKTAVSQNESLEKDTSSWNTRNSLSLPVRENVAIDLTESQPVLDDETSDRKTLLSHALRL